MLASLLYTAASAICEHMLLIYVTLLLGFAVRFATAIANFSPAQCCAATAGSADLDWSPR